MSTERPVLFDLAQPDTSGLTTEDLLNPDHPVNIKGQSGKRKGMAVMIKGRIYVAQGSNPKANWVCINDNTSYPNILRTETGHLDTRLDPKGILRGVNLGGVNPAYSGQGSYLKSTTGTFGFILKEKGTYRIEISATLNCSDLSKAMAPVEFILNKKVDGGYYNVIHSAHSITELMMLDDTSGEDFLAASFNMVDYVDAEANDEFLMMARSSISPLTFHVSVATIRAEKLF